MDTVTTAGAADPEEAAERTFREHRHDEGWLDAFIASLDRRRAAGAFTRTTRVLGPASGRGGPPVRREPPSDRQVALARRPPARADALADLAAATELLVRHLNRDRIPAVVRRPIPALDGVSLVDLLGRGDTGAVLSACRDMFRFLQVHT